MSYATIIAAIDSAIEKWAGRPVSVTVNGKTSVYRSLVELTAARSYYASLVSTSGGAVGFQLHRIKAGGPV